MNIWIIDHYSVPPKYYPLARNTIFARKLGEKGHNVTIFCASSVHNSNINLLPGGPLYKEEIVDGVRYVYVRCKSYTGNGVARIMNMLEFAHKLKYVVKHFSKPDAVLACSMTLQACYEGIRLAKKYNAKAVAQVTDLWPESLIAYGKCSKNNPVVWYLRGTEKKIYKSCDELIFSMEGAYDYIVERNWEQDVPRDKVHFINNGVDLLQFRKNQENYTVVDEDLDDDNLFNVIYAGSIRRVNSLGILLDAAKLVTNPNVKFLIWGDGDEKVYLEKRVKEENIHNVVFKGVVDKKYIPYITSKADLNLMHGENASILRYGLSSNKIFDYFAAGKPIMTDIISEYDPITMWQAGKAVTDSSPDAIAAGIDEFASMCPDEKKLLVERTSIAARHYDFESLTESLERVLEC